MVYESLKRFVIGDPLASQHEKGERVSIPLALAVFAPDALSSTAYATQEILMALILSNVALQANEISIPIAFAILFLIIIVVSSYRQVIRAYPDGGGAYVVAKKCLGEKLSLVAGASLLIDYVLTAAVSLCAAVEEMTSFRLADGAQPIPVAHAVPMALAFLVLMVLLNLRGLKESGKVLVFPIYTFILSMYALIGYGCFQVFTGQIQIPVSPQFPPVHAGPASGFSFLTLAGIFIGLKAFSHGCSALTGIEAISNGVTAFKEPVVRNANRTMILMGIILGTTFLGLTYLALQLKILPLFDGEDKITSTVISLVNGTVFGAGSWPYMIVQFSTMTILVLAANTSFAGFPRICNLLANDGYLPRQLMALGDRLVFSNGILILGALTALLILIFQASSHLIMPLFAIGVFLSFTLAQSGMLRHHWMHRQPGWKLSFGINLMGALTTGLVTLLLTFEKFLEGAWMVIVAVPPLVWVFQVIKNHYLQISKALELPPNKTCPVAIEHTVMVLVSSLNRGTIPALEYAKSISENVEAVHVEMNQHSTEKLRTQWNEWGCGIPLVILKSPFRSVVQPLIQYIQEVEDRYTHDLVTIIVPEIVPRKFWHHLLHNQTALLLKTLIHLHKGKVVTTVRYYLEE